MPCSREPVRLKNGKNRSANASGRVMCCHNLARMMGIVVNDGRAIELTDKLETTVDTME
jgi:hypothetical protein